MIACLSHQLWANRWREPPAICNGDCAANGFWADCETSPLSARDVERRLFVSGYTVHETKRIIATLEDAEFIA